MDHYNEQLVKKCSETKDTIKIILIIVCFVLVTALTVLAIMIFGFMPLLLLPVGAAWLAFYLITGLQVEYEYIVTNNDMDIDKITGKRRRKRLITVKLNTVEDWGEYTGNENTVGVGATVMASDGSGTGAWYIIAEHKDYGKVMVIFTPTMQTASNINFGVPHSLKKKNVNFREDGEAPADESEPSEQGE